MRREVFEAIKTQLGRGYTAAEVALVDALLDQLGFAKEGGTGRELSGHGLAHIKASEGLELKAYPDPASGGDPWTVGYGHTGPDVKPGLAITDAKATALLRTDVERFEAAVRKLAPVTTQGQFDAMVSFAFNAGEGALAKSTLLKLHNAGNYSAAANEFGKWVNAAGKKMPGLITRRAGEAAIYRGRT